jgi:hypothetical protein
MAEPEWCRLYFRDDGGLMKRFSCTACGNAVFFENAQCINCGHRLGFVSEGLAMDAFAPAGEDLWRGLASQSESQLHRECHNRSQAATCNWMIPVQRNERFCLSCRLNKTIPDLSVGANPERWKRLETAKRRLVYGLLALQLPIPNKEDSLDHGIAFEVLADPMTNGDANGQVITGHAEGSITINVAEADPVAREAMRLNMNERYRTLLGHFRHEIGHYYWDRLVFPGPWLAPFRELFGDERDDYAMALQRHYDRGAPANWQDTYISSYASVHPWEDWAETWAHYMLMLDTLETAFSSGFEIALEGGNAATWHPVKLAPAAEMDRRFADLIQRWIPLTVTINSINRSMGLEDPYPFVLSRPVVDKLHLVHQIINSQESHADSRQSP